MPSIRGSQLPGLLGLKALTSNRAILDCVTKRLYFLGPGNYDLMQILPAGTKAFDLETAPSGHLVLPITHYNDFDMQQRDGKFQLDQTQVALAALPVDDYALVD